jgi:hypothetical protein
MMNMTDGIFAYCAKYLLRKYLFRKYLFRNQSKARGGAADNTRGRERDRSTVESLRRGS